MGPVDSMALVAPPYSMIPAAPVASMDPVDSMALVALPYSMISAAPVASMGPGSLDFQSIQVLVPSVSLQWCTAQLQQLLVEVPYDHQ